MKYHYICEKCGLKIDKEYPMGTAVSSIDCNCGGTMIQDILGKKIQSHLPEDYQACSEYHSVDYGSDDVVERCIGNNL